MSARFPFNRILSFPIGRVLRWVGLCLALLLVAWLGFLGWHIWNLRAQAQALQAELAGGIPTTAQAQQACGRIDSLASSAAALDAGLWPARGLLPYLGWLPQLGPTLTQVPALLEAARAGGEIGRALCSGFAPAFPLLDARRSGTGEQELLAQALPLLTQALPSLDTVAAALGRLDTALSRLDVAALAQGPLASYAPRIAAARERLPQLRAALDTARSLIPLAAQVIDPTVRRRYLMLAQNSGEIRATGGYIGSLGTVLVDGGRVSLEEFSDGYALNTKAPPDIQMPISYLRYLRIDEWYLRDANWYADFPTSAQKLRYFWQLNRRPPVDGIVGVDLYAFLYVMQALGPLDVQGYGRVDPSEGLESIFKLYAGGDKRMLGRLLGAALDRLREPTPGQALGLLDAIGRALRERHILLAFDDPEAQTLAAAQRWDGALVKTDGDYLMVVDSDFSYSEVALFVDARITYSVTLDAEMRPLTATVGLDYANSFDLWKQGHTSEQVLRYCVGAPYLNGCYGNFVRLYVPRTAGGLAMAGLDGKLELLAAHGRQMIANHMFLVAGELRHATASYSPGVGGGATYRLYVQKQPGTLARPLRLVVQTLSGEVLSVDTDLPTDREIIVGRRAGQLVLLSDLPAVQPQNRPEVLQVRALFLAGWDLWQQGKHDEALARWRAGAALPLVIDRVNMLLYLGFADQASELVQAALRLDPQSSRALFALGMINFGRQDYRQAEASFQRSLALDAANAETRNMLDIARRQAAGG